MTAFPPSTYDADMEVQNRTIQTQNGPATDIDMAATAAHRAATISRKPVPTAQAHPTQIAEKPRQARQQRGPGAIKRIWTRYSRRTRIIIIAVIVAVLILIIGLAAGLSSRSKKQNLPLPSSDGGPYEGDLTYYAPGLGACGVTSNNGDRIVAVSHLLFDAVQVGSNPNTNPLCGKKVRVKRVDGDVSVDLTIVDRCTGCQARDLDMTEDTFATLADVDLGRVLGEWSWLDTVPGAAGGS